jgi:response regulator RpfG family c-di-GMP phosphodiesterase
MNVRPRILALDDDPYILEGLQRNLRSVYNVVVTTEPQQALDILGSGEGQPVSVILSDMRMPGMTGVAVLEKAQQLAPEAVRILMTGDANVQVAVAAINRGSVFRYVIKPCPAEILRKVIDAAVEQHRLMRAERELLQDTLKGCIDALMDTLAMAQPALFSRSGRLRKLVADVCAHLEMTDSWQIEMAAQLGEIGAITLPPTAIDALQGVSPAGTAEAAMLASLPGLADSLLAKIPRMEPVRDIIRGQQPTEPPPAAPAPDDRTAGTRVLQAVREFDALTHAGTPADQVPGILAARHSHDESIIDALAQTAGKQQGAKSAREIGLDELRIGQELAADLLSDAGQLLISRGQTVDERLLMRVHNFAKTAALQSQAVSITA